MGFIHPEYANERLQDRVDYAEERIQSMYHLLGDGARNPILGPIPAALMTIIGLAESMAGSCIMAGSYARYPFTGKRSESTFALGARHFMLGLVRAPLRE